MDRDSRAIFQLWFVRPGLKVHLALRRFKTCPKVVDVTKNVLIISLKLFCNIDKTPGHVSRFFGFTRPVSENDESA